MLPSAFRAAGLLLALAAILVAAGCGEGPEARKQKALERARGHAEAGKLNEAVIEFQNALQVDPSDVSALHGIGRVYARKAWVYDAVRELGRARQVAPDDLAIAGDYGRALLEIGAWTEAEAEAQAVFKKQADNQDARYIRAVALLGQGKAKETLQMIDALPGPAFPEAAAVRAEALLTLGQSAEAEAAFRHVLAAAPGDVRSLVGLGAVSLGRKSYEEAERLYVKAKELRPDVPRIRLWLAASKAWLGKLDEAIKELEEIEIPARTPDIGMALCTYHLRANQPAEAIACAAPLVQRLPRFPAARMLLAAAYLANHDAERAIVEITELERQRPDDPAVQFRLALAEAQLGRPSDALARLDRLAKPLERAPDYHFHRGRALLLLDRLDEALREATAARSLAPEAALPYLLLGQIKAKQGDSAGARALFEQASARDAGLAASRVALGQLDLRQGDVSGSLAAFEEALRADPRSVPALRSKTMALLQGGRVPEAIAFVQSAAAANPQRAAVHALLGSLHLRSNQPKLAEAAFKRALEQDARSSEARLGLMRIALAQGKEGEAIGQLQELVKHEPAHGVGVLLLTTLYGKHGRADLAVPMLEAAVKANPRDPNLALLLGDHYLKTARYPEAAALMAGLLARSPEVTAARLVRGQALLGQGDNAAGLRELEAAAKASPRSAEIRYALARAHLGLGRLSEARAAYHEAVRLNPALELARIELSALPPLEGGATPTAQALAQIEAAVRQDPKNVALLEALVRARLARGDLDGAYAGMKRIIELAPLHVGANLAAGRILVQQGRIRDAVPHFEAVLRVNPNHVELRLVLARELERQGKAREAVAHLEVALAADPSQADAKLQLGGLYLRAGRLDDALALSLDVERLAPRSTPALILRGAVLLAQRDFKASAEAYAAAVKASPGTAEPHRGLGQALEGLGQTDRAVESYRRALALSPDDLVSLNNLAWLLTEVRRAPDQALPLASKAAEVAPQSPEVMDTLGWVHYRRGAYAEAQKLLERAVERLPDNAAVHYHLGMTYYRLGKRTDALYTLRRAVQLDPKVAEGENVAGLMRELGG